MKVLVTGAAGYIGSHTLVKLLEAGHEVIGIDNFVNSSPISLKRVKEITQKDFLFFEADVCDVDLVSDIVAQQGIDAAIHFAGLKAVGESVQKPIEYFNTNINSTTSLIQALQLQERKSGIRPRIIFSSSATVYGSSTDLPFTESTTTGAGITNPYGFTKYACEELLKAVSVSSPEFQAIALRYFNPIGAHPSGLIGEDPSNIPNNLFPYLTQVAIGKLAELSIFGNDYPTSDGTGVRDYIHVQDLASGHVAALKFMESGFHEFNLGTGNGTSVLQLINTFQETTGVSVPYKFVDRREGDVASSVAEPQKANSKLGWRAELSIEDACRDSWAWQSTNPEGYK